MTANEDMARAVSAAMRTDGTLRPDPRRAAENRQHVREQVARRDPVLVRALSAFFGERDEHEPARTTRARGSL